MNRLTEIKHKYPTLNELISDSYTEKIDFNAINNNGNTSLEFMLYTDDSYLKILDLFLYSLSNKKFKYGKISNTIKCLKHKSQKTTGGQFFNTLSEIVLKIYFLDKGSLLDYDYPFTINKHHGDFDLLVKIQNEIVFMDIVNLGAKSGSFNFSNETIQNTELLENIIIKKTRNKYIKQQKEKNPNQQFGIAIDYTKNDDIYVKMYLTINYINKNIFLIAADKIFEKISFLDYIIFFTYRINQLNIRKPELIHIFEHKNMTKEIT